MILDYFGDESDVIACDCDVCRAGRGGSLTLTGVEVTDEVNEATRKILSASLG